MLEPPIMYGTSTLHPHGSVTQIQTGLNSCDISQGQNKRKQPCRSMCTLLQQVTVTKLKSTRVAGAYLKVKCQEMQNLYGNNTIFAGTLTWLNMHNKLVSTMKLDIPFILNRSVRSQEWLTLPLVFCKTSHIKAVKELVHHLADSGSTFSHWWAKGL